MKGRIKFWVSWIGLCLLSCFLPGEGLESAMAAAPTIEGISDRQIVARPVRFRVVPSAGYTDQGALDGSPIQVSDWTDVALAGYHELIVVRTQSSSGAAETTTNRFIIMDAERGSAEVGLYPWTPRPAIDSAPTEFTQARLALIMPGAFPSGLPIPVVAFVRNADGRRLGLNGTAALSGTGSTAARLRRGVGFAFLPPAGNPGSLAVTGRLHDLASSNTIEIDQSTAWTDVTADVTQDTLWAENARLFVRSNLTIRAGVGLTVDAGVVVKLGAGVTIQIDGSLVIRGTTSRPAVFLPVQRQTPWGGFVLPQRPARVEATGAIFAGSGADPRWYKTHPGGVHRLEQSLFDLGNGAEGVFRDCWIIDNAGQAFHGEYAALTLDRCLVQRSQIVGQFNGGSVQVSDSALIEFPRDDAQYVDGDNDCIYFTWGTHRFSDTLIGWTKDDGIDAGGDAPGDVRVERCWFESCFHEGMALSGSNKVVNVSGSVFINNGQAVEAGYYSPIVTATNVLMIANEIGARFGDNYEFTHTGFLRVTNSFILRNYRDIWGFVRELWSQDLPRMDVSGNWLTKADPLHANNQVWQPDRDGPRLAAFRDSTASVVGIGFFHPQTMHSNVSAVVDVPVGLSCFSDREVMADYVVQGRSAQAGVDFQAAQGTLRFASGEMVRSIPVQVSANPNRRFGVTVEVLLTNPVNAAWGSVSPQRLLRLGITPTSDDTDGDGLPDDWEERIVSALPNDALVSVQDVYPEDDFDGDGLSNETEFLAGTDPTDPHNALRLSAVCAGELVVELRLPTARLKTYRIEMCDALGAAGGWEPLATVEGGPNGGLQVVRDQLPPQAKERFYRAVELGGQ